MSGGETMLLVLSWAASAIGWFFWYRPLLAPARIGQLTPARRALVVAPPACLLLVLAVLTTLAASDVRGHPGYLLMYTGIGSAWLAFVPRFMPWLGISAREDVGENGNLAAAAAISGALAAVAIVYAGANIGDGPGFHVVLFCAALSTAGLLATWGLVELLTRVCVPITVERDLASGVRLGGFLVGASLILGRAVAGDWESAEATVRDFGKQGWPVVFLLAVEIPAAWAVAALGAYRQGFTVGALLALGYIAAAVRYVVWLGPW